VLQPPRPRRCRGLPARRRLRRRCRPRQLGPLRCPSAQRQPPRCLLRRQPCRPQRALRCHRRPPRSRRLRARPPRRWAAARAGCPPAARQQHFMMCQCFVYQTFLLFTVLVPFQVLMMIGLDQLLLLCRLCGPGPGWPGRLCPRSPASLPACQRRAWQRSARARSRRASSRSTSTPARTGMKQACEQPIDLHSRPLSFQSAFSAIPCGADLPMVQGRVPHDAP